jgi:hypothetical protein
MVGRGRIVDQVVHFVRVGSQIVELESVNGAAETLRVHFRQHAKRCGDLIFHPDRFIVRAVAPMTWSPGLRLLAALLTSPLVCECKPVNNAALDAEQTG